MQTAQAIKMLSRLLRVPPAEAARWIAAQRLTESQVQSLGDVIQANPFFQLPRPAAIKRDVICPECGQRFMYVQRTKQRKYCSPRCRQAANNRYARQQTEARYLERDWQPAPKPPTPRWRKAEIIRGLSVKRRKEIAAILGEDVYDLPFANKRELERLVAQQEAAGNREATNQRVIEVIKSRGKNFIDLVRK